MSEHETTRQQILRIAMHRTQLLDRLLELTEEQRRILLDARHADLLENLGAQDLVVAEFTCLQEREKALVENLRTEAGYTPRFEQEYNTVDSKAAATAMRIRSIVRTNSELLENAMQFVTFSLGVISSLSADQPSYDSRAETQSNGATLMLDLRV